MDRSRRSKARHTACDLRRVPLEACTTCPPHQSVRQRLGACEVFLAHTECGDRALKAQGGRAVSAASGGHPALLQLLTTHRNTPYTAQSIRQAASTYTARCTVTHPGDTPA